MPSDYELKHTPDGERFVVLADDPDLLIRINEKHYREAVGDGFHESNALNMAILAPFRVTLGFGVVRNFATLEAALAYANETTDAWRVQKSHRVSAWAKLPLGSYHYDICGPEVEALLDEPIEHESGWTQRYETIHRPTHDEFIVQRVADRHRELVTA